MNKNEIDALLAPLRDADIRNILLAAMRDAAAYLHDDATRRLASDADASLAFDHYTDSDDYAPAAARFLDAITSSIFDTDSYDTAYNRLFHLLADDDFIADAETCDFSTPLLALIIDDDDN